MLSPKVCMYASVRAHIHTDNTHTRARTRSPSLPPSLPPSPFLSLSLSLSRTRPTARTPTVCTHTCTHRDQDSAHTPAAGGCYTPRRVRADIAFCRRASTHARRGRRSGGPRAVPHSARIDTHGPRGTVLIDMPGARPRVVQRSRGRRSCGPRAVPPHCARVTGMLVPGGGRSFNTSQRCLSGIVQGQTSTAHGRPWVDQLQEEARRGGGGKRFTAWVIE